MRGQATIACPLCKDLNLKLKAFAKINLSLRIIGKREDGYHDIVTFYQRVSLCDEIELEPYSEIKYNGPALTVDERDNLCFKAAEAFRAYFGAERGAVITLTKNIPLGAGLGGGSADAAAVLRGMAKIYRVPYDDKRLFDAALTLGSDVPFFLSGFTAAYGYGRGERLKEATGLKNETFILILWPGFPISSKWAYKSYDNILTNEKNNIKIELYKITNDAPLSGNDFEKVVFKEFPELESARVQLLEMGSYYAALSGSGSALFGLYDDEASAQAAVKNWQLPWHCFVCRPY